MRFVAGTAVVLGLFSSLASAAQGEIFFLGAGQRTILADRCDDRVSPPRNDFVIEMRGIDSTDVAVSAVPGGRGGRFTLRVVRTGDALTTLFYHTYGEDCAQGVKAIVFEDGVQWTSSADVRAAAESDRSRSGAALEDVATEVELRSILDDLNPRFWSELGNTGKREAIETFFALRRSDEDRNDPERVLGLALRYARVNDALYYGDDLRAILEPELSRSLGWGERENDIHAARAAAELATMGTGRRGTFASYEEFSRGYRTIVDRFMTGR